MKVLIDCLACLILLWIAVEDLRRFRIRNQAVLGLLALFGVSSLIVGGEAVLWHAAFAAIVMPLMIGAFAFGIVGAGDAKLMTAACLWAGPENAVLYASALFGLTLLTCIGAALSLLPIRGQGRKAKIPFGPSIAGALIAVIVFAPQI